MSEPVRFWTADRSRRIAIATLLAIALGGGAGYTLTTRGDSAVQSGDFPVFHAVGRLIVDGQARSIYDLAALQRQQAADWPQLQDEFFPFAYPAFYAALLAPLGLLPPLVAKGVFSALMLCFALAALLIGVRLQRPTTGHWPEALALGLALVPLDLAIAGGQNSALSLLLLVASSALLQRGDRRGDVAAGALLGLWLFKPHFALMAIGMALAMRRWRVLLGALPVALLLYGVGALVFGVDWIGAWRAALGGYVERDYLANQHQMVCLVGAAHALASSIAAPSWLGQGLLAISWLASAALLALGYWRAWCSTGATERNRDPRSAGALFALVGPLAVLTSPHTVIYDLPLALLPALLWVRFDRDREVHGLVLIWIAVAIGTLVKDQLSLQPLVLVAAAAWLLGYRRCQRLA